VNAWQSMIGRGAKAAAIARQVGRGTSLARAEINP
jgi:hypothetical protein